MRFGPWEIIIIVMCVVILFGAKKIPEIMRGLGSGFKEFKSGLHEGEAGPDKQTKKKDESS